MGVEDEGLSLGAFGALSDQIGDVAVGVVTGGDGVVMS